MHHRATRTALALAAAWTAGWCAGAALVIAWACWQMWRRTHATLHVLERAAP